MRRRGQVCLLFSLQFKHSVLIGFTVRWPLNSSKIAPKNPSEYKCGNPPVCHLHNQQTCCRQLAIVSKWRQQTCLGCLDKAHRFSTLYNTCLLGSVLKMSMNWKLLLFMSQIFKVTSDFGCLDFQEPNLRHFTDPSFSKQGVPSTLKNPRYASGFRQCTYFAWEWR